MCSKLGVKHGPHKSHHKHGPHMVFDPLVEALVKEVKVEMIAEGLRYGDPVIKKPIRNKDESYVPRELNPVQFRGSPGKKTVVPNVIRGRLGSIKYFGDRK